MLSDSQRRQLERMCNTYREQLPTSRASDPNGVIDYLEGRSIDWHIAQKYQLGYVAEPIPGDERFAGRLAIPYLANGKCVAINFRSLDGSTPKYLKPHGQKARLYNALAYFAAEDTIGVSEGELDAVIATERLGVPTLGVPGSTNYQDTWDHLFRDFNKVVIWQDGDLAGQTFANNIAERVGWRARVVVCDPGEDVSSMVSAGDTMKLIQLATGGRDD